jgi:CRISPR/Cas system CSM-associated protein Csm2 small subunit
MLWSAAQAAETKRNQVARECLVSLPYQLPLEGMRHAARHIGQRMAQHLNTAVQVSLHRPPKRGSDKHWHLHAMFPTRRLEAMGLTKKLREFSVYEGGRKTIEWCRKMVAEVVNSALELSGVRDRVDHRSGKRQKLVLGAKLQALRTQITNRKGKTMDENDKPDSERWRELLKEMLDKQRAKDQQQEKEMTPVQKAVETLMKHAPKRDKGLER